MASRFVNKGWRSLTAMLLVVSVSACVSNDTRTGSLTPAEQQMRQESKFFSKSNVQACLATGAAAAVVTWFLSKPSQSDRRDNRTRNATIAFATGCGIGVGVNSYVQSKRTEYRNSEQRMNSVIADLRQENQRLSRLIDTSGQVMQQDRERIAEIDRAYRQKNISLDEAQRRMERVRDNRDHLKSTLAALKEKQDKWHEVRTIEARGGANTTGLDAEIAKLERQVDAMEGEIDLMDEQITASPVPA